MPDFARHLPLSNRPRSNESGVTGDRRVAIADAVDEAARVLASVIEEEAEFEARARRFLEEAGLGTGAAGGSPSELLQLAETIRAGRRRNTRLLVHTVRALLVLGDSVEVEPRVAAHVSGAVALAATGSAPFERRAVLRGHTVRAVDEGWSFGNGPVLEGRGREIVRFVLALDDIPPLPISSS